MEQADIPFLSATELSQLIETREVSPVEVVQAHLERIDAVDSNLNSYITVCRGEAIDEARQAERAMVRGNYLGPMHGIPVAIKDQFCTKNIRTTAGSTILADYVPNEDATVVTNLKRAGAILLGKLNMSEFAMGEAFRYPYGTPRNPLDQERIPGTSSGGSGAALAGHLCAASVGEDTGGSIRNPASYCGIVGLRPTYGRVSRYGMLGSLWSMDTPGPMARTVADCAMALQAIAGFDPKDLYTIDRPVPDYSQHLDGNISGIRVGVVKEMVYSDVVEPDVRDRVLEAITLLGELTASVEDVAMPLLHRGSVIFAGTALPEVATAHRRWIKTRMRDYDHNIQVRQMTGSIFPAQVYYKAQKLRALFRQQVLEALQKVDVLVLPTTPTPAPKIPTAAGIHSKKEVEASYLSRRNFTPIANLAGIPAISVPCGFTSSEPTGLPIGLQIVGRPFEEGPVLKVAHAYEKRR